MFFLSCLCSIVGAQEESILRSIEIDYPQTEIDKVIDRQVPLKVIKPFQYEIYPSQVDNNLQVILPLTDNFTLRLVDQKGKVLFSHFQIFGENQVNLGHLKADTYLVEISSTKGKIIEEITKT